MKTWHVYAIGAALAALRSGDGTNVRGHPRRARAGRDARARAGEFQVHGGPLGTAEGGLYFSDIPVNKTFYLDPGGKIAVVRENTNGANGIAFGKDGELLFAEGDGKRISKRNKDGSMTTLTEGPAGKPLLSPNDLILDGKGGIYFTDPGPRPVVPGRPTAVHYLPAGAKEPVLIDGEVARPNGLTLTNDGKTLIVDDTIGPTVFAYDVQPDGSVKNKRPFATLHDIPAGKESGADGLAIDRNDRVYITTVAGVQVFDAKGGYLGTIKAGRQGANVPSPVPASTRCTSPPARDFIRSTHCPGS